RRPTTLPGMEGRRIRASHLSERPLLVGYISYIRSVLRPHRRRLVIALVTMLGVTLVAMAVPLIIAFTIDTIIGQGKYHLLTPMMLLLLAIPFLDGILRSVADYTVTLLG